MKNNIIFIAALVGAFAWTACQKAQEEIIDETQEIVEQAGDTWTLTVEAERNDGPQTKGLALDGDEATTTLLKSVWKANEEVKVYLGTDCIGTLTATPDATDAHKATLSGEITTSGITAGVTMLTLLTPRESWDYTGQNGSLLISDDAASSIEKKYHYTMASSVRVTSVSGGNITTEPATFSNQQSIYRMSFRYRVGDTKTPITTKSVTISGANGHLVQSQVPGGAATEGPLSVALGTATADPFFVALRNGDETNAETLTFTVLDNDGVTYRGTKEIPAEYKANGTFVSIKNASLTERLQLTIDSVKSVNIAL